MKAAVIERTGAPEEIRYVDWPTPEPKGREVLVAVRAVTVNPIDTYIRSGMIPMPIPLPYIVGCDLAGVVEKVGPEATRFHPGDRVWGSNQGLLGRQGTFAERVAVDEDWLYSIPDSVGFESAAAIALVGITAHLGLFRDARLRSGETLYIGGASGGVGSTVVQMACLAGARVIASTGSLDRADSLRAIGADVVLDYHAADLSDQIRAAASDGIDVWWETRREPDLDLAVPLLNKRGRIIVMAGREARPTLPLGPFYVKDCQLLGFAMFNAPAEEQRQAAMDIEEWMRRGRLHPRISRTLPLSQTAEAHRLQESNTLHRSGELSGKIVLTPDPAS